MEPIIFHIDVNSAYLSWTALEKLSQGDTVDLRLIPSIIGGDIERRHGVVLAKSLPAKTYGIVTGEPVVNALKKCPHLTMAPPDHAMYIKRSKALMDFLSDICPDIEQASIDECYMDFTSVAHLYSSPIEAAISIKDEIYRRFGFTVNIGISDKKVLAKMASDFKKPNLVHTLYAREIAAKLWPLPISSLFMCGRSSTETLRKLEILTIGELAKTDPRILASHLKSHGILLWNYANGIDDSMVISEPVKRKGVGNSTTLSHDVTERAEAAKTLLSLSESVGKSLRAHKESAGLVCVEIKYNTFQTVSHQTTLQTPTSSTEIIYQTALSLFDAIWSHCPIRLLGVRASHLTEADEPVQLSLFDRTSNPAQEEKQKKLDAALDSIRTRYGSSSIVRGSLLPTAESEEKKTL
ncbi:MAG: DNA polymerase IV [Lachnospiraceae bacterium]|nr:DNA polymerase IV [Lachnospiraceae bacterium]